MKKILFLTMLPLLGFTQINKLDEKKGFKNFIFGTPPDAYNNILLELHEGNTKLYSLDQKSLAANGPSFEYLRLTFYKNKLSVISFKTMRQGGAAMLRTLRDNYGEPDKKDAVKNKCTWTGSSLHLVYEGLIKGEDAMVSFYDDSVY